MKELKRRRKVAELILDFDVYPRHEINGENRRRIREAIQTGAALPPPRVCARTMRVADGFHRITEYVLADPTGTIDVVLVEYADDAEMFLDAARCNATHGRPLAPFDVARCAVFAERLSIAPEAMAAALCLTREKYDDTLFRKTATTAAGARTLVRNGLRHLAIGGKPLSAKQEEAARVVDGMQPSYHVNQIVALVEGDAMPDDPKFYGRLLYLRKLLNETEIPQP